MATTASARAHRQHGGKQQQYQLLRRLEGLSLGSALHSDPHAPALTAAALLIPLGAVLLGLSGLFLLATLAGVALAAPLVLLFGPVLVPAALTVAGLGAPAFFGHRVGDDVGDALGTTKTRNVAIT
ncbi:hypothetical protein VPH35_098530 [Triticum aestivum]|uniref:oleosin Zm-II-like n=1 Tax=Triticum aestivum TaxID=4565 RepID=UPI001D032B3D|nr:oleosin Zm-II-like [Triticum aestivum]